MDQIRNAIVSSVWLRVSVLAAVTFGVIVLLLLAVLPTELLLVIGAKFVVLLAYFAPAIFVAGAVWWLTINKDKFTATLAAGCLVSSVVFLASSLGDRDSPAASVVFGCKPYKQAMLDISFGHETSRKPDKETVWEVISRLAKGC